MGLEGLIPATPGRVGPKAGIGPISIKGKVMSSNNRGQKDYQMIELWDDRCVALTTNTGLVM